VVGPQSFQLDGEHYPLLSKEDIIEEATKQTIASGAAIRHTRYCQQQGRAETYLTFIIRVSVTSTGDREDGDNSKFIRVCVLICNKGRSIAAVMSRLHSLRCRYQLDNRDDMRSPANPSTCGFEFTVGKIRLVVQTILRTLHLFLS
jgi:hypothetical protein